MQQDIQAIIEKYPQPIQALFGDLRTLVLQSTDTSLDERLWAKLPSYYAGARFVRLLPFKDHINVEAAVMLAHKEQLAGCKLTPKGMLRLDAGQAIPAEALKAVFRDTLQG